MGIKLIFPEFSKELLHAAMWLKLPEGQGSQKIVCFAHKILVFFFFLTFFFFFHVTFDPYNMNVKFLIFFKFFNKVHSVEVWNQDPCQQKYF
jgi:hypothetical protein